MDSPVRQYQKQKDYRRHKLFRKIRRRRKAEAQQAIDAPMKELRRRLKRYDNGKDIKRNLTDQEYYSLMERVAEENNPRWNSYRKKEGERELSPEEEYLRILNDNSYNYRAYYNKYPNSVANADTHWPDEFKTAFHPTFSIYSTYSGYPSQYNPQGVLGGTWFDDQYIPAWGQLLPNNFNKGKDSGIHIKPQNRGKFTALKKRTGKSASWFKAHGTPAQKKMATFALNARKWKHK